MSTAVAYTVSDGNPVFYTDEGEGDETILLIHGGACDSHDWSAQIAPFTAKYRVIAPDLRGRGRSPSSSAGGHSPADFTSDLARLIDELDAGPVVAMGHSLGGLVASMLAVEHPESVRAVVAVDPGYGFETEFAAAVAAAFRSPDPVGVAVATFATMESSADDAPAWLPAWHRRGCPVLTVSAEASLKSKGITGEWDLKQSQHSYSESVIMERVGHWLHQEAAAEFNETVLTWIDGLPAR